MFLFRFCPMTIPLVLITGIECFDFRVWLCTCACYLLAFYSENSTGSFLFIRKCHHDTVADSLLIQNPQTNKVHAHSNSACIINLRRPIASLSSYL